MRRLERAGLDALLVAEASADVASITRRDSWLIVGLEDDTPGLRWHAVWRRSGAVYAMEREHGPVADDPWLVPEGSPYSGPVVSRPLQVNRFAHL